MSNSDYAAAAVEDWGRLLPGVDQSPLGVTLRIRRAASHLSNVLTEVINESVLSTYGDYEALSALRRADRAITPSDLADRLLVTRAGVTGRLDRLESGRFIRRTQHPDDARSAEVSLTPSGRKLVDGLYRKMVAVQTELVSGLSAAQERDLARLLERLLVSLDDTP